MTVAALQAVLAGDVLVPGSEAYETARRSVLCSDAERPAAVALCRDDSDVAQALAFARRSGLRVAARSGGHCFAGRSSTDGIVVDVSPMHDVKVAGDVATVGAGTRLETLYDALEAHGVTLPAGCGPTVGIAGLTLGGGIGILGRRHGLTCDRLLAARVVLATGESVDCDAHRHPDLYWALRGAGGGQFGIVTSLVFRTVPAPEATLFELTWPHTAAGALVAAWQDWAPDAPEELNATLRIATLDDADRPLAVAVDGAMLAGEAATSGALGRLVAAAGPDPVAASLTELPYRRVKRTLAGAGAGDRHQPPPVARQRSEFFRRPLPPEAIAELLGNLTTDRRRGETRELAFTPLGGAYARVPADATAYVHRAERFLLEHASAVDAGAPAAAHASARAWLSASWACAHRWGSGRVYPNFPDPELTDWAEAYHGSNLERLGEVKRRYDPEEVFSFPQGVAVAGPA